MALPVAPLGQLASMNMPYSRPYYEKNSTIDKAIAAFLTGLAANAGGQIVENVAQRDFAEQPAGFWSKLTQGPKESRQQFEARQNRLAEQEAQKQRLSTQERLSEADRLSAESRFARQLADNEDDRGLKRTMFDLQSQQTRKNLEFEAAERRRIAQMAQSGQLDNIIYEYGLKDWLAGQNQPRELDQIRALGEARKTSTLPPWTQQPQTQQITRPEQPSKLWEILKNPKTGIPGVGPALSTIDAFTGPQAAPVTNSAPTAADVSAIQEQQSVRPITIEQARQMGLPEEWIRQLFPTATDTLIDIVNPRGGANPNLPPVVGTGQRR